MEYDMFKAEIKATTKEIKSTLAQLKKEGE